MAVLTVNEIHDGREGGDESGDKGRSKSDDTRRFRVTTSSNYDGSDVVLRAFAGVGAQHPTNPNLFIRRRRAVNESFSKRVWIVTLSYSNESVQGEKYENPLMDRAKISWNTESVTTPAHYDKDGNAILNSAGQPFIDGLNVEESHWAVKIRKNLAFVPLWINNYRNAVNSDAITIDGVPIAVRAAKVTSLAIGEWEQRNDIWYRPLDLTIRLKDTWVVQLLDQGFVRKHPTDSSKRITTSLDDGYVNAVVSLDGSGNQLANPSPDNSVFLNYHVFPELSFSFLPLN